MFKIRMSFGLIAGALALGLMTHSPSASAQSIYTAGHADVGVGYDDIAQEFEPHWHTGIGAVIDGVSQGTDEEFEPGDLIALTSATRSSPTGSSGILGLADGSPIWAMGSSTYQPNLGVGAEELNPSDWVGGITITFNPGLSSLPAGGHFGLYTTNIPGTTVVDRLFSSFDPLATDFGNSLEINPGDHLHFQWAFTELGDYDLSFTWSGTHVDDGLISTTANFSFQAVPEPSTTALLGGVGVAAVVSLVRRRMSRPVA